jgi:RTX calcium-binding nonapeptide repeat (4 copies)
MSNNPSQGLNLGGQPSAYGDTFSALDLVHGADAWITYDANGNELRGKVATDAKGWVPELPVVDGVIQPIQANVFYTKIMPAADYIVEWKGEGTLGTYSNVEQISDHKFRIKWEGSSATNENGITLFIEATDPNKTGNYIRDIQVYQEKYTDLVKMGEHFDPKWFQQIDDFRVLRTHDWQGTNFSKVTDWTDNDATADQAFWVKDGRGMPFELLVEAANQSRSDLWINIPHMATDEYMRKAAQYVKDHLDKDLKVYVEYTNEYWTTGFDQHNYLIDKGAALFGNAAFANAQAYGARASEMTQIFKAIFGSEQPRLIPTVTLNHDAFNTAEALTMLNTPDYVARGGISPLDAGIKFLGTDGYLSWFNTDPDTDAMVDKWMKQPDKGYGSARDFLINQLNTDLAPAWAKGRALADKYGLNLGIYEGGALLLNGDYDAPGAPRFTQFNEDVQLSSQMRQVYEAELAAWKNVGSGPFAWYSDTGRWGPGGDYGLWNAPNYTPEERTKAIIAANNGTAPWWTGDTRAGATFDNGKYDAGTANSDVIQGTNIGDRLYGLGGDDVLNGFNGDDTLVGGGGKDRLNGGSGGDVLVGGVGADINNGGSGFDFASFQTSDAYVNVDLTRKAGLAGDARGDTLTSIEGLIGGAAGDILRGDAASNRIDGGVGRDRLFGNAGVDYLKGGLGNDVLSGGLGNDVFYLGPGIDVVTDWTEGDKIAVSTDTWAYGDPTNAIIQQVGSFTKVTLQHGNESWQLLLQNTLAPTITVADDFIFS